MSDALSAGSPAPQSRTGSHRRAVRVKIKDVGHEAVSTLIAGTPTELDAVTDLQQRVGLLVLGSRPTPLRAAKAPGA